MSDTSSTPENSAPGYMPPPTAASDTPDSSAAGTTPPYAPQGYPGGYDAQPTAAPGYPAPPAYGAAPSAYAAAPAYGHSGYAAPAPTNSLAVVALIAGIAGLFIVPFLGSIVAIVTGHMALNRVKTSGEQGRGLAIAGLIMGYVGVAFAVLFAVIFFFIFLAATSGAFL